jgi:hypothetical protein
MDGARNILSDITQNQYAWYVLTYKWILAIKYKITSLQSTYPKKSNNREGSREDGLIFLRRGNKIDISSGWRDGSGCERGWGRELGRGSGIGRVGEREQRFDEAGDLGGVYKGDSG